MTQPLALVVYEVVMPGGQVVNRLRELGYRVQTLAAGQSLTEIGRAEKPIVVLIDLVSQKTDLSAAIRKLRADPETAHIPVIAFGPLKDRARLQAAQAAGATLVTASNALADQLPALLDQALALD